MQYINGPQCALTESFGFGPTFAPLASRVLQLLRETPPLCGQPSITSTLVGGSAIGNRRDLVART
jgi:hypothetical protein